VGSGCIIPRGSISLSVTFKTSENYRTETNHFDIAEVNLSFNAIIRRLALYQFMAIIHYGYLVLKMASSNGIIKIHGDHSTSVSALEKLQTLAVTHEVAAGQGAPDQALSSSCHHISSSAPYVQPSDGEDVPVKVIQSGADAT
jgi:hypothetical protein